MKLQLKEWRVKNLSFDVKLPTVETSEDDNKFKLLLGHAFSNDTGKEFVLGFKISLNKNAFDLELEMIFIFETDVIINEDLKNSSFLKVNAPAIAFPYIRSYISNLTLQSGYAPIILPSINFVALSNDNGVQI